MERMGLDHEDRQAELDEELRTIDAAIASLKARRVRLMTEYLEVIRRSVAAL